MDLKFKITYHEKVIFKDIPKLAKTNKERIKKAIEDKLTTSPEIFGKPLRKSLNGYRKLRVGDFRVIFRIKTKFIKIFNIEHRSVVYKNIRK